MHPFGPPPPHLQHHHGDPKGMKRKSGSSAEILRLTPENAVFSLKNGFPQLILKSGEEEKLYGKVSLRRSFPFDMLWQYISVLDEDDTEVGLILDVSDFGDAADLLKSELEKRYYEPKIASVISVKERYGFSYWKVSLNDERTVDFTMQDTFRNIIRAGEDKAILLDVDGNRFVIESIKALDKKSYKKIELYL